MKKTKYVIVFVFMLFCVCNLQAQTLEERIVSKGVVYIKKIPKIRMLIQVDTGEGMSPDWYDVKNHKTAPGDTLYIPGQGRVYHYKNLEESFLNSVNDEIINMLKTGSLSNVKFVDEEPSVDNYFLLEVVLNRDESDNDIIVGHYLKEDAEGHYLEYFANRTYYYLELKEKQNGGKKPKKVILLSKRGGYDKVDVVGDNEDINIALKSMETLIVDRATEDLKIFNDKSKKKLTKLMSK